MAGDKDRRTEKPTGKQLNRAYERGQVARSVDVGHAVSLAVFLLWAGIAGSAFLAGMAQLVRGTLLSVARPEDVGKLSDDAVGALLAGARLGGPLLLALMVFAVLGGAMQGGIHLRKPFIRFDLHVLNPVTGLGRFISMDKVIAALKAIVRTAIYAMIAMAVVFPEWPHVAGMALLTPQAIFSRTAAIALRVLLRSLLVSVIIAGTDYAITRYRWYRGLYMTKQETRDEAKENENPEIKGRIRGKQRETARRRMMAAVRTASVVVTNPTHVSVALRWDRLTMAAPVVVAKGRGYVALRIREEAGRFDIPIVEDPPLARALERLCPENSPIPETLYRAVAEVLAYVFKKRRGAYKPHVELEPEFPPYDEVTP